MRICVVTGSRADYGLLYWLMRDMRDDPEFELQVAVTGMHLSPEFGLTVRTIEADGFEISARVEMLLSSDTPTGTTKSVGVGVAGFADALDRLRPTILVLLGDRFEIFAAAQAALFANIPVAHLCGGDTTEGAFDEALRHSITKMAHLHLVTNHEAERRVRQLGENPEHVFNVGSPGIDFLKRLKFLPRAEIERRIGFQLRARNLLVTFHPATLNKESPGVQFDGLLRALDQLDSEGFGFIFTKPNADSRSREIIERLDAYVATHANACAFSSLGQELYLSVMAQVDAVVGNSSSGLYEAPSLGRATVDIGDRQKGRLFAASVTHCEPNDAAILSAIQLALKLDCRGVVNPYGSGDSVPRIIEILKRFRNPERLLSKHFFEVGVPGHA